MECAIKSELALYIRCVFVFLLCSEMNTRQYLITAFKLDNFFLNAAIKMLLFAVLFLIGRNSKYKYSCSSFKTARGVLKDSPDCDFSAC